MGIYYYKLFDLLNRRGLKKGDLMKMANISSPTMAKLSKNEIIQTDIINRICQALNVQPNEIMEYISNNASEIEPEPFEVDESLSSKSEPDKRKDTYQVLQEMAQQEPSEPIDQKEYHMLLQYLGSNAIQYSQELKKVKNGSLSIPSFFTKYCNHGSFAEFNKFKDTKKEG